MAEGIKIWGPPGTGKTTRLLQEVEKFKEEEGKQLYNATIVTYRKEMAADIKSKMAAKFKLPEDSSALRSMIPYVGTIHSVSLGLCSRLYGSYKKVASFADYKDFANKHNYSISTKLFNDDGEPIPSPGVVNRYLITKSWLAHNLKPAADASKCPLTVDPLSQDYFRAIDHNWSKFKSELNLIDFEDMLLNVITDGLCPPTDFLLADEFQDFTPLQYKIYKIWSDKHPRVLIAGDPNQSIYGYSGGSPSFFNSENFPRVVLRRSYRLSASSIAASEKILNFGKLEVPKVKALRDSFSVCFTNYDNMFNRIDQSVDTFILCRTNYLCSRVRGLLNDKGFVFYGEGGWSPVMVAVFNSLRFIRGYVDSISRSEWLLFLLSIKSKLIKVRKNLLENFIPEVQLFNRKHVFEFLSPLTFEQFRHDSIQFADYFNNSAISRSDFMRVLSALHKYPSGLPSGSVRVMTIHAAKGSEADDVFLLDGITPAIEEGLISGGYSKAEEARVFYVGATRHRRRLFVVNCFGEPYLFPLVQLLKGSEPVGVCTGDLEVLK